MNSVPPLVKDIHERGAALFEPLAQTYGTHELERSLRRRELLSTNIAGYQTISLGPKGRAILNINNQKTPSPQALLDELTARLTITHYERNGWKHHGKTHPRNNIHHFSKPGETSEYVPIKRTDYHQKSIYRLLNQNAQTIAIHGGILVLYIRDPKYAQTLKRQHQHRIDIRPFQTLLNNAHQKEANILTEVPA